MNNLCVIIPVYKENPSEYEKMSLFRYVSILKKRDIFLIAPKSLKISNYLDILNNQNISVKRFSDYFFKSAHSYNRLMLNCNFYQQFVMYDYMLIAQLDAMVISKVDRLDEFMNYNYDYWGAPWFPPLEIYRYDFHKTKHFRSVLKPVICYSGNGGFSLRKIDKTIKLIKKHYYTSLLWNRNFNEDCFFAYFGHSENEKDYKCPPQELAKIFSIEKNMKELLDNGDSPFGVHGWQKYYGEYNEFSKYLE